jgi:hypothetical protein
VRIVTLLGHIIALLGHIIALLGYIIALLGHIISLLGHFVVDVNECSAGTDVCRQDPNGLAICVDLRYGYYCRCKYGDQTGIMWNGNTNECELPDGE